jgi:hypothetical protein
VALIGCVGKDYENKFRSDMSRYGIELPNVKISDRRAALD